MKWKCTNCEWMGDEPEIDIWDCDCGTCDGHETEEFCPECGAVVVST